uniref:MalT-like TPR region domain-containing protein n=1 Tax=Bicosoecida sp. CB-2014 TaxID=1486930 RepID=A0A7S1G842_9STRA|mmetsp:Transcript_20535/g.72568  ORF Transcript_20535/g.72568 Transcript_20535/m.72568 type:complete len:181 (+) Transcript_20535:65-607(+)
MSGLPGMGGARAAPPPPAVPPSSDFYEMAEATSISMLPRGHAPVSAADVNTKLQAGIQAFRARDHTAAARLFEETVALARVANEPLAEARALANLASVYKKQDRVPDSVDLYRAALASLQRLGDGEKMSSVLKSLADCLESLGRYDEALATCEQRKAFVAGEDARQLQERVAALRRLAAR